MRYVCQDGMSETMSEFCVGGFLITLFDSSTVPAPIPMNSGMPIQVEKNTTQNIRKWSNMYFESACDSMSKKSLILQRRARTWDPCSKHLSVSLVLTQFCSKCEVSFFCDVLSVQFFCWLTKNDDKRCKSTLILTTLKHIQQVNFSCWKGKLRADILVIWIWSGKTTRNAWLLKDREGCWCFTFPRLGSP